MPRVEELEPRNVPERPLKREVKREGAQRNTRARGSDVSRAEQALCIFLRTQDRAVFHPCQSYPLSQSTPDTSTPPTHPAALWQQSAGVHKTSLCAAPPCLLSVSHSLSCECHDLWTDTGSGVCVCVYVRNCKVMVRRGREASDVSRPSLRCQLIFSSHIHSLCSPHPQWQPRATSRAVCNNKQNSNAARLRARKSFGDFVRGFGLSDHELQALFS